MEFFKLERNGRHSLSWEAVRGKRTRVPGPVMAAQKDIPHDLAQYVVEAAVRYESGFWGLLAQGATYKSTGRKRTKAGRAVIAEHRAELAAAEALAARYLAEWKNGVPSPTAQALDRARTQWEELHPHERLVFEWPSTMGDVGSVV